MSVEVEVEEDVDVYEPKMWPVIRINDVPHSTRYCKVQFIIISN